MIQELKRERELDARKMQKLKSRMDNFEEQKFADLSARLRKLEVHRESEADHSEKAPDLDGLYKRTAGLFDTLCDVVEGFQFTHNAVVSVVSALDKSTVDFENAMPSVQSKDDESYQALAKSNPASSLLGETDDPARQGRAHRAQQVRVQLQAASNETRNAAVLGLERA